MRRNDMANIDDIAYAIGADKKNPAGIKDWFGRVVSMSPFKVARLGSEIGVECVNLAAASVGDMVYVLKRPDGQHVSIGRVGGSSIPVVLYDDETGTQGTITLPESAENFEYMRIYFRTDDGTEYVNSADIYQPNGKRPELTIAHANGSNMWVKTSTVVIDGTSIRPSGSQHGNAAISGGSYGSTNPIYITRIEAWSGGASIGFGGGSGGGGGGGGGGSQIDLLWTNPNPTSAFSAQDVSIPWQNYKFIIIEHYTDTLDSLGSHTEFDTVAPNGISDFVFITSHREVWFMRGVQFPSSGTVHFGSAFYPAAYNSGSFSQTDSYPWVVPTRIWGVKQGGSIGTATDVLYADDSGTTGTVTLSKSAANYDHMRIFFRKTNDVLQCASVDVYEPNGKYASLFVANPRSAYTDMWTAGRLVLISGTSITNSTNGYAEAQIGSGTSGNGDNRVAIYRVEAWNDGGGAIADYIIETGETDGWHWEKWNSGKAEAWATKTHSVTINENYGNGWYSSEQHDDIPSGIFTSMEAVTLSGYGSGAGFGIEYGGGQTTTRTCSYWLMRVEGSAQPSTAYISIMAKGRWK